MRRLMCAFVYTDYPPGTVFKTIPTQRNIITKSVQKMAGMEKMCMRGRNKKKKRNGGKPLVLPTLLRRSLSLCSQGVRHALERDSNLFLLEGSCEFLLSSGIAHRLLYYTGIYAGISRKWLTLSLSLIADCRRRSSRKNLSTVSDQTFAHTSFYFYINIFSN